MDFALTLAAATLAGKTAAWIAAAAALTGSLIGGLVTGGFSLWSESKRQAFARETERLQRDYNDAQRLRAARGAAREWQMQLRQNADVYSSHIQLGLWWNETQAPAPADFNRDEDRVLVTSLLTNEEWARVERGEVTRRHIKTLRDISVSLNTDVINAAPDDSPLRTTGAALQFDTAAKDHSFRETLAKSEEMANDAADALNRICSAP